MSDSYEGWGEHHAYRCGKDDGWTSGYFNAIENCIEAAQQALLEIDHSLYGSGWNNGIKEIIIRMRKIQSSFGPND